MMLLRYLLVGCCFIFQPWSAAALSHGKSHPKVLECCRQIDELRSSGTRIDVGSAEQALERAMRRRTQLRNDFGTWHPEVLAQTRQIAFLANLLNGQDTLLKK